MNIIEKLEKAQDTTSAISTGRKKWTMSVPADIENDPDLIISDALISAKREIEKLQMLLWLRHGCSALYGDDGEMQCGHCRIDFKRDTAESIEQKWYIAGHEALKG